jgi:hypothetical protein
MAADPKTSPSTAPTTAPAPKRPTDDWVSLPDLPTCSITQVIHFSESQGLLVTDWPILSRGPVEGRLSLNELPGVARIGCIARQRPNPYIAPTFEYWDFTNPDQITRHLQVLSSPGLLSVVQAWENDDDTYIKTVSLLENLINPDPDPVTLRVQIMQQGQPQTNVALSAATLSDLRYRYPFECEEYLRPMFREFHQEAAVFSVEDRIAWQVMASDWIAPPDLAQQVEPLVGQLNSSDFSRREQAQASLHQIGEPAALFLHFADRKDWSAEQSARIRKFLAEFFVLTDGQVTKLTRNVDFLLDCLVNDDPALRAAALKHLDRVLGRQIEYKLDQPLEDRLQAVERLRRQLTQTK